jgi:uncharacterized membrane protein YsdA (DUF1294 family)
MMKARPVGCFLSLALVLAVAATAFVAWYFSLDVLWAWLIGINAVTFLVYGYDKAISGWKWTRVPEKVLLAIAFIGGTGGAFVARILFNHKTAKESFRRNFWLVIAAQVGLIVVYLVWIRPLVAGGQGF